MTNAYGTLVDALGRAGVKASPAGLAHLADTARRVGVPTPLVDVLVDDREPICARVRAYGRVSSRVYALSA